MDGVAIEIDIEAVVVRAERPLRAVSSAIVGGGVVETRSIELGWLLARAVKTATDAGVARWMAEHP